MHLPPCWGTFLRIRSADLSAFFSCLVSYSVRTSLNSPASLGANDLFDSFGGITSTIGDEVVCVGDRSRQRRTRRWRMLVVAPSANDDDAPDPRFR